MKKKQLLQFKKQYATPSMMKWAQEDELKNRRGYTWADTKGYHIGIYYRCLIERDILKVSVYLTEHMKSGGKLPAYEIFLDKRNECFITYDCLQNKWREAKHDSLPWPRYKYYSDNHWISENDHRMIKQYLGTVHGGYAGICEFQLKVREEELKRRYRRETDPWDLDLSQTKPTPKDWDHWIQKVGIPQNFIFYQYTRGGAKTGYCSFCEKEVPIKNPRHNLEGKCPKCGHKITFKAIGRMGSFSTPTVSMYLVQSCDAGFMIRQFCGSKRYYRGKFLNPHYSCWEVRRAIYSIKARPVSAYYWGVYKQRESRWIRGGLCSANIWGSEPGLLYGKSLAPLFKNELRNTGLQHYMKSVKELDPEKNLANYNRVPQLEQMVKADLKVLVRECLNDCGRYEKFFAGVKESSLIKALGIDAPRLKRLRDSGKGIEYLEWLRFEKAKGLSADDELLMWFVGQGIEPKNIAFIENQMRLIQIRNYIQRQAKENKENIRWVLNTWADYLAMAKRLGMDTTDSIIYRVRKLKQRHKELVERCEQMSDELYAREMDQKFPSLQGICQSIQSIYSYKSRSYMICVPSGALDIVREGSNLHHCVGNQERYFERMANRESYVLFLRRTKDPDKPYYTLEVEPDGTVRQKRTMFDRQEKDIAQATKFLRKWQSVVATRITAQERALAVISKELRQKEFETLKQENKIVYIRNQGSRRLLDLLLEDLMENTEAANEPVMAAAA